MTRQEETKAARAALKNASFRNFSVKHGKGTSRSWLQVRINENRPDYCECGSPDEYGRRDTCNVCLGFLGAIATAARNAVQDATGRNGEYDGRINISIELAR